MQGSDFRAYRVYRVLRRGLKEISGVLEVLGFQT